MTCNMQASVALHQRPATKYITGSFKPIIIIGLITIIALCELDTKFNMTSIVYGDSLKSHAHNYLKATRKLFPNLQLSEYLN